MLDRVLIRRLFRELNREMRRLGASGEIGICGGAVMCLVFNAREATKYIDAVFRPTKEIRQAAKVVAAQHQLPESWLNDAAKAYFHVDPPREPVLEFSNLRVWAPRADYMLAMKCVAARYDTHDRDDVLFLIRYLGLKTPDSVFTVVENYYPRRLVPSKTRFLVEELFEGR